MICLAVLLLAAPVPADLPFQTWFESRGVRVEMARMPQGPPWLRGTAELPASAETVAGAVGDFASYRDFLAPAVTKADLLESGEATARLHMVWRYPFPFRNRDAVVRYRLERLDGGRFRLTWQDEARPGDPSEGVRIARVSGSTSIEPTGPGLCRVTYTYLGDLGGSFPRAAEQRAWREEPVQYMRAIRRRLKVTDPPK